MGGQATRRWWLFITEAVDHNVAAAVFKALEAIGLDMGNASPMSTQFYWLRSPTPVTVAVVSYLLVVWLWCVQIKRAGGSKPKQQQDSVALRCLVIGHNLFLALLSVYLGVGILWEARRRGYAVWGNPYREREIKMGHYIYIFYISKLYEFVDTGIMLWRRNLRQITYLHIYHHASISFIWWIMAYRYPGGDAYFSAAFNSWIHVFMYAYYLLSAILPKDERTRRKYLFWGKYLTLMQIVQFLSFIGQAVFGMLNPGLYPPGISRLLFFYSMSLLLFFSNFFIKKYFKPVPRKTSKDE